MGVENNECVIAITRDKNLIAKVKSWICDLDEDEGSLFSFTHSLINRKETIFLAPCGSKKGWHEDKKVEGLRDRFIQCIKTFDYEDGSSPFSWVEVGFGEFGQKVLRGNCKNVFDDDEYYKWESYLKS